MCNEIVNDVVDGPTDHRPPSPALVTLEMVFDGGLGGRTLTLRRLHGLPNGIRT